MKFYSEITLPESGEVCRVGQLSFSYYYELNKFLQNDKSIHIEDAFFTILRKYTNKKHFTAIDGAVALIFMRLISIGSTIEFVKDNTNYKHEIIPLLENLCDIKIDPVCITFDDITINIKTPYKFCDILPENYLYSAIVDNNENIFTLSEQQSIFSHLPAKCVDNITGYIRSVDEKLSSIVFKVIKTDITCSLENYSLFEILKLLYSDSITDCQRKLVRIVSYTKLSAEYVDSLPPAEVEMLLGFIAEQEAAEQEAENKEIPITRPP